MNISKDNINSVKNIPGTNLVSCIVPCTEKDNYPTHDSIYGKGGWREVRTIEERNAIPVERRKLGMAVYVTQLNKVYILKYALNDTCWYEFNSVDAADVVNAAIDAGTIHVDIEKCVTKEDFDYALASYNTSEEEALNIETSVKDVKRWVAEQEYLTEHQSLDGLATEDFVQESVGAAVSEVEDVLLGVNSDIKELKGIADDYSIFKADAENHLSALDEQIVTINEFISGESGEEIEVATKASVEELAATVGQNLTDINDKFDSFNDIYAKKEDVDEQLGNLNKTVEEVTEALGKDYMTTTEVKALVSDTGFITKGYLKGFATESYVQDYVARVMDGSIKPGTSITDYKAEIAELQRQINDLSERLNQRV